MWGLNHCMNKGETWIKLIATQVVGNPSCGVDMRVCSECGQCSVITSSVVVCARECECNVGHRCLCVRV